MRTEALAIVERETARNIVNLPKGPPLSQFNHLHVKFLINYFELI